MSEISNFYLSPNVLYRFFFVYSTGGELRGPKSVPPKRVYHLPFFIIHCLKIYQNFSSFLFYVFLKYEIIPKNFNYELSFWPVARWWFGGCTEKFTVQRNLLETLVSSPRNNFNLVVPKEKLNAAHWSSANFPHDFSAPPSSARRRQNVFPLF